MPKKEWRNVYQRTNPSTGRRYYKRVHVTVPEEGEVPPPPDNFPEGNIGDREEVEESSETKKRFVPTTYPAERSKAMDERQDNKPSPGPLSGYESKEGE
jgi:hypothetical protein